MHPTRSREMFGWGECIHVETSFRVGSPGGGGVLVANIEVWLRLHCAVAGNFFLPCFLAAQSHARETPSLLFGFAIIAVSTILCLVLSLVEAHIVATCVCGLQSAVSMGL